MDPIKPAPPTGIPVTVNLLYCDGPVLLEAFDFAVSRSRWTWLAPNYVSACAHADAHGFAISAMGTFPLGPANPCFSFNTWVTQPKEAFHGFVQSRIGASQ